MRAANGGERTHYDGIMSVSQMTLGKSSLAHQKNPDDRCRDFNRPCGRLSSERRVASVMVSLDALERAEQGS
jgi:hypothetical protein